MTHSTVVVDTPFSKVVASDGSRRLSTEVTFAPDAPTTDAFGRLRVSNPHTIFDAKTIIDAQPLLFDNEVSGTGAFTYVGNRSATELTSGTGGGVGNSAIHQTRRYFNYQPGKSQLVFVTFNMYGAEAGCRKRVGYFDQNDGVFLQVEGDGTVSIVQRSSVGGSVNEAVATQANWNRDKMNGTGIAGGNPSGVTLDLTKVQIMVVDFEWLGVGVMRVGFDIDGQTIYVHQFLRANVGATVYMKTPNLPVRWEIQNTGTPGVAPKLDAICCSVQSEGGANPIATKRATDTGIVPVTIGTTLYPLMSIRLKAASQRATVFPDVFSLMATGVGDYRYAVMLFPSGAGLGPATVWTPLPNSAIEYNLDRTIISDPSGAVILSSGYASATNQSTANGSAIGDLASVLALGTDIDGTTDEIVLAVQTLSGTNTFVGGLGWIELL